MEIGQVIGTTTLRGFRFVIKEGQEGYVKRNEFVSVKEAVSNKDIVGVIKEISISNELLPDEFGRDLRLTDVVLNEGEYPVPIVNIVGCENNGALELPRHGIKPGSQVELVDDETLSRMLRQDLDKSAFIGTLSVREKVPVYVSINELVSKHCAILAMTGAGKSYTVGVLIEEIMKKKGSVVVFDLHGEYKDMKFEDSEAKVFGIEGGNRIKIDVASLYTSDFENLIPDLTDTQRDLLDEVISLVERFYDGYDLSNILTTLETVYDMKKGKAGEKKPETDAFPEAMLRGITKKIGLTTVGALIRRIKRLERMGIFDIRGTALKDIVRRNQLTIINLSDADERVSETVISAISRAVFNARRRHLRGGSEACLEIPTILILEEAHNFAPRATERAIPTKNIIKRIAREGRKFGVGLCIVSQRPNRLDADVLSQCNTQVIMKMVNPADQEYIRQSVEAVTEDVVRDLPGLSRGEAIVVGSAIKLPVPVRIRERTTAVGGGDIDIVAEWNKDGRNKKTKEGD